MIRKFWDSQIKILNLEESNIDEIDYLVIQAEKLSDNLLLIECLKKEQIFDAEPMTLKNNKKESNSEKINENSDAKNTNLHKNAANATLNQVEEFRDVTINHDPFGKYSGRTLGEIFDKEDWGWVEKVITSMKNDYIKSRVEFLAEHYLGRNSEVFKNA